jgi:hypothetical protein|tara:strand:- start:479 stop:652 length:174 start_codon:yes stop_codon:yes gene_type:complete
MRIPYKKQMLYGFMGMNVVLFFAGFPLESPMISLLSIVSGAACYVGIKLDHDQEDNQ